MRTARRRHRHVDARAIGCADGDNGSAMVLGMTRDELFDAFSRFLSSRGDVRRGGSDAPRGVGGCDDVGAEIDDEPSDAVVVERAQPAKVHAKAKPKKRR